MTADQDRRTLDPADLATLTPSQLLVAAAQDEASAIALQRVGRWPSDRNAAAVAYWLARVMACREAAE